MVERVIATDAALSLIASLQQKHGALMFHQSGGCCDGSAPMCYPLGEFITGDADIQLGSIGGTPFFMSRAQFEYWQHTQLIIDVVPGRGGMFSLEGPEGLRFLTRSRIFTDEEVRQLAQGAATCLLTASNAGRWCPAKFPHQTSRHDDTVANLINWQGAHGRIVSCPRW